MKHSLRTVVLVLSLSPLLAAAWCHKDPDPIVEPPPQPGEERVPREEDSAQKELVDRITRILRVEYPTGTRPMKRDAHPKHHGCVKGTVRIHDDIPEIFKQGMFATPHTYDAWIRFSNSGKRPSPDKEGDGRGIAVKVMGVPGEKILDDEKTESTVDFLAINHPVFFVGDAVNYAAFARADEHDNPVKYFISIRNPATWHTRGLQIATTILGKKISSPLEISYFSMTPYRHGHDAVAVKFRFTPCKTTTTAVPASPTDDYLREVMSSQLRADATCFTLALQRQGDPVKMPVEDATILWDDVASPFVDVATVDIPAQYFESEAQMNFCENLSYTPWHTLPAHRPLGGLNRIRRAVYEATSVLRHAENGAQRREPDGTESFPGAPE